MKPFLFILALIVLASSTLAQIPINAAIQVLKAEDALRYDKSLEGLLKNADERIRTRAALAAGRIGNEAAIPVLTELLEKDGSEQVRVMAAFALGEIESIKAADAILKVLGAQAETRAASVLMAARLLEAAGKIAAANPKEEKSKLLGEAILDTLEAEHRKGAKQHRETVLLGLTAALRAKPEQTAQVAARFLASLDARIRADAANTLSRIRAKKANEALRTMLMSDPDAVARANAARALGAAEDKDAFKLLLDAATEDDDLRVRVSAIRALASLKDAKAADKLLGRGESLVPIAKKRRQANAVEQSELLEIATALGRLLPNSNNERAIEFFRQLRVAVGWQPESNIAFAQAAREAFFSLAYKEKTARQSWKDVSSLMQAFGEYSGIETESRAWVVSRLKQSLIDSKNDKSLSKALPDTLRAFAKFKSNDLEPLLRLFLHNDDLFHRGAAAELIGEQLSSKENSDALKAAFANSLQTDKVYNDAQLAILSALVKIDKNAAADSLKLALDAPDHLVRRHGANLIRQNDLAKNFPGFENKAGHVRKYVPKAGTKMGQVLNTDADYRRAARRKNGNVKAVLTTEKGTFTIEFLPEDAPLTVDNFIKLAKSKYFDGLEVHRVVPNFVMQDGDPRGDGNGGPGWSIRCEINMLPYERGSVGMALSGKDTGGSQWFVTHAPQPHLDGGYTIFGRVSETGMKIVDNIVRGDKVLTVKIIEAVDTALHNQGRITHRSVTK